jgi:hypothetical protein
MKILKWILKRMAGCGLDSAGSAKDPETSSSENVMDLWVP